MRLREAITVSDIPDPGALLGAPGSAALHQAINESLGSTTFFGSIQDIYSDVHNVYLNTMIAPLRQTVSMVSDAANVLFNPDVFRPLVTLDAFEAIPACMQLPIVMYEPVRKLLGQGRIGGFGFDPDWLPTEDVYGRLINNGHVEDVLAAPELEKGYAPLYYEWHSDDPDLDPDELDAIRETRRFIDYMLMHTACDPTNISSERG